MQVVQLDAAAEPFLSDATIQAWAVTSEADEQDSEVPHLLKYLQSPCARSQLPPEPHHMILYHDLHPPTLSSSAFARLSIGDRAHYIAIQCKAFSLVWAALLSTSTSNLDHSIE